MVPEVIFYAFLGGLLPAVLWLWFWLREDSAHPEPRGLVAMTFIAGAISVVFVLPIQYFIHFYFSSNLPVGFFLMAGAEELLKFAAAYTVAIRSKADDEPIDVVIYMVTAALGFSAVENALFSFQAIMASESLLGGVIVSGDRFVSASLVHVVSSAVVGLFLAFAFYKPRLVRQNMIMLGLVVATALHTMYNLSIINSTGDNSFFTFAVLWLSVIGLLLFFEKIKRLDQVKTL